MVSKETHHCLTVKFARILQWFFDTYKRFRGSLVEPKLFFCCSYLQNGSKKLKSAKISCWKPSINFFLLLKKEILNANETMNSGLSNITSVLMEMQKLFERWEQFLTPCFTPGMCSMHIRHMDHGYMCKAMIKHIPEKTEITGTIIFFIGITGVIITAFSAQ